MKSEVVRLNGAHHPDDSQELLTEQIGVTCSPIMVQAIKDYRHLNQYGSQSAAVRRLIELGLEVERRKKPNSLI